MSDRNDEEEYMESFVDSIQRAVWIKSDHIDLSYSGLNEIPKYSPLDFETWLRVEFNGTIGFVPLSSLEKVNKVKETTYPTMAITSASYLQKTANELSIPANSLVVVLNENKDGTCYCSFNRSIGSVPKKILQYIESEFFNLDLYFHLLPQNTSKDKKPKLNPQKSNDRNKKKSKKENKTNNNDKNFNIDLNNFSSSNSGTTPFKKNKKDVFTKPKIKKSYSDQKCHNDVDAFYKPPNRRSNVKYHNLTGGNKNKNSTTKTEKENEPVNTSTNRSIKGNNEDIHNKTTSHNENNNGLTKNKKVPSPKVLRKNLSDNVSSMESLSNIQHEYAATVERKKKKKVRSSKNTSSMNSLDTL